MNILDLQYKLYCEYCGWARAVQHTWLRKHFPGMTDVVHATNREYLVTISKQLRCSKCGEKKAQLIVCDQNEKKVDKYGDSKHKKVKAGVTKQKEGEKGIKEQGTSLSEIKRLLKDEIAWLYGGELSIIQSYKRQIESGKSLTEKQHKTVKAISNRVEKRKEAKFVRGGSPGLRNL